MPLSNAHASDRDLVAQWRQFRRGRVLQQNFKYTLEFVLSSGATFQADAVRGNVIRYEEETSGYPEKFGIDRNGVEESWDYVTVGGSSYLVPMSAEFMGRATNGYMWGAVVEYKNHRHFEASTKVTIGEDK